MEIQECVEAAIRKVISGLLESIDSQQFSPLMERAAKLEFLKKKPLLTPGEINQLYGIPVATLATWRSRRLGPDMPRLRGTFFTRIARLRNGWISAKYG